MKQKMRNTLCIYIYGIDLTKCSNFEFCLEQDNIQLNYDAVAHTSNQLVVEIPYDDAMKLEKGCARCQAYMQDEYGNSRATNVMTLQVEELIAKDGYKE